MLPLLGKLLFRLSTSRKKQIKSAGQYRVLNVNQIGNNITDHLTVK